MKLMLRFILLTLALGLLLCSVTRAGAFDIDSLLVASVGGPPALRKLRAVSTISAVGRVHIGDQPGRFEVRAALPDKLYLKVDLGGFSFVQAFDGETAWQQDQNGMVAELSGYEKRGLVSQVYFQTFAYLFDDRLLGEVAYLGMSLREGHEYHHLVFYPLGQDTIGALYDPVTGLQRYSLTKFDNLETVTESGDYRLVDSVWQPFYSYSIAVGAPMTTKFEIDSVWFDESIDSAIFQRHRPAPDYRFPPGSDSMVVSFELVGGHIYLPVTINGVRRLWLILDSGASGNILHEPAIEGLDLAVVGSLPTRGIGGYDEVDLVQTDSLAIGGLVMMNQVVGSFDLSGIGQPEISGEPFGGVIGYDFLSRFPVLIDYQQKQLTVYNPESYQPSPGGTEIEFRLTMQVPTIRAELVGIPGDFIVDLGNSFGLIVHSDFSQRHDLANQLDRVEPLSSLLGGVGDAVKSQTALASNFVMGNIRLDSLNVILSAESVGITGSLELAGNIGNLVLRQFRVMLDYRRRLLVLYEPLRVGPRP